MKRNNFDEDILGVLNQLRRPASTDEIAQKLNKAWHSVQKYCYVLKTEGKIQGFRVGRLNLWSIESSMREQRFLKNEKEGLKV
jgi:Mn-dependent DtxR family transcriptional regulator